MTTAATILIHAPASVASVRSLRHEGPPGAQSARVAGARCQGHHAAPASPRDLLEEVHGLEAREQARHDPDGPSRCCPARAKLSWLAVPVSLPRQLQG
jgi:hypothetical protein